MKKTLFAVLTLSILAMGSLMAQDKVSYQKYYGKVSSLDLKQNQLTVTNKKKKTSETFVLASDLTVKKKRQILPQTDLAVGQNLIVYFQNENQSKVAKKITVRSKPVKK